MELLRLALESLETQEGSVVGRMRVCRHSETRQAREFASLAQLAAAPCARRHACNAPAQGPITARRTCNDFSLSLLYFAWL